MTFETTIILLSLALLVGMTMAIEFGRRIGLSRIARDPDGLAKGVGPAEGAVFGLFGLLLAFTFSGAAGRYESRRDLVAQEANAIGTAWQRLDLLPAAEQAPMRDLFRAYLDSRLLTYASADDESLTMARYAQSVTLQDRIWEQALVAARRPELPPSTATLLLPALNEMFDVTTLRLVAVRSHPPVVVFILLFALSLVGALLVGYNGAANKSRSLLHSTLYSLVIVLAIYVILDLEYPRLGLIRIDKADAVLIDLRESIG